MKESQLSKAHLLVILFGYLLVTRTGVGWTNREKKANKLQHETECRPFTECGQSFTAPRRACFRENIYLIHNANPVFCMVMLITPKFVWLLGRTRALHFPIEAQKIFDIWCQKKAFTESVWSGRSDGQFHHPSLLFGCLSVKSSRLYCSLLVLSIHGRDFFFTSHSWYDLMMFHAIQRFSVLTAHEFSLFCAAIIHPNDSWPGAYFPSRLRLISVNIHDEKTDEPKSVHGSWTHITSNYS